MKAVNMKEPKRLIANPEMIKLLANRNKCWMCKHKFEKPVILPVEKASAGLSSSQTLMLRSCFTYKTPTVYRMKTVPVVDYR